jgi:transposase
MAKPRSKPQLSFESAHIADDGAGIPDDHWCRLFFEHVYLAFDDAQFGFLYKEGGRYPVSPSFLACVTLLQYMFRVSDREAVENTIMRRDWRIALGITAEYDGFHSTVLVRFRQRLKKQAGAGEIFDMVLERMEELGLVQGRRRLRVDATHLLADVARLSWAEALSEAMRIVICDARKRYDELATDKTFEELNERYGEESWLGTGEGGDGRLVEVGHDALRLLSVVADREVKGKETLAELFGQVLVVEEDGSLRPYEKGDEPPAEPIATPHDPDARRGKKRNEEWVGDKVHVVETAAEDDLPNVIVDVVVTDPRVADSTMIETITERARAAVPEADTLVADNGYASAANTKTAAGNGFDLVAPPRPNTRKPGKFPIEAFSIDFEREVAICPEGHESVRWAVRERDIQIRFDTATCARCPRRSECTDSTRGRTLAPSREYEQLQRDRARAKTDEFRDLYRLRAPIEGTISQLVHRCGFRRSRYRGAKSRELHAWMAASALNVRRMLRWLAAEREPKADQGAHEDPDRPPTAHRSPQGALSAAQRLWIAIRKLAPIIRRSAPIAALAA